MRYLKKYLLILDIETYQTVEELKMNVYNGFQKSIRDLLEKNRNEILLIHGTGLLQGYSILKNGFYFDPYINNDMKDCVKYDDVMNNNYRMLDGTTMIILNDNVDKAVNIVLNYRYNVGVPRGEVCCIILKLPNKNIQEVHPDKLPEFYNPIIKEGHCYIEKKSVLAMIDKINNRVITIPTEELDEEFQKIKDEEEKKARSLVCNQIDEKTFRRMEQLIEIINDPNIDSLKREKARKELEALEAFSEKNHIDTGEPELEPELEP